MTGPNEMRRADDRLLLSENGALLRFVRERCPSKLLEDDGQHSQSCPGCSGLLSTLLAFTQALVPNDEPGTAAWAVRGYLRGEGCLGRSAIGEPVFTLVARDILSDRTVADWAERAESRTAAQAKVDGAVDIANRMAAWREANGGGKVPD
jgi:hypothetical protein